MTKLRAWTFAALVVTLISVTSPSWGAAPSYKVLYEFQGPPDGYSPSASLILDASGNLYGTTQLGGTGVGAGTVFELTPTANGWTETVLYSFQAGTDGGVPNSTLVMDQAGNLYGTTEFGGSGSSGGCVLDDGCGIVFELTPPATQGGPWTESILYVFQGSTDGSFPNGVILDQFGNLYGTTVNAGDPSCGGGSGCGTAFELSPLAGGWTETTLYAFQETPDANQPESGLTIDASGNLYGATYWGGSGNGRGTIYELSPSNGSWSEKILYSFNGDQMNPGSTLVFDSAGDLVGTAEGGNHNGCCGEVFALKPEQNGNWTELVAFRFSQSNGGLGGANSATPAFDPHGNLYGTSGTSGKYKSGAVYQLRLTKNGIADTYYSFCAQTGCPDGDYPNGGVTLDSAGNVYGTTFQGGIGPQGGYGVVYEITP
jgi:uncharacterized repeat protein (TIGR03803 family)